MNQNVTINPLTPRQTEIVALLADGNVRKFVAQKFGVSEAFVCQQIREACDRAKVVRKDSAIVSKAIRSGWIA